jgi:hypothetical protein
MDFHIVWEAGKWGIESLEMIQLKVTHYKQLTILSIEVPTA